MHDEVMSIYRHATPATRHYYGLAHYVSDSTEDNWIIRWMLWHVFRYRDSRNKRANPGTTAQEQASETTRDPETESTSCSPLSPIADASLWHDNRSNRSSGPKTTSCE